MGMLSECSEYLAASPPYNVPFLLLAAENGENRTLTVVTLPSCTTPLLDPLPTLHVSNRTPSPNALVCSLHVLTPLPPPFLLAPPSYR